MSPRARAGKSSSNRSPPSLPIRKLTRSQKKTSLSPPKQKRLSSLTASTLVHYCTTLLSPGRRAKTKKSVQTSEMNAENHLPVRSRREASSRASAMIMQQNEIERSRLHYSHLANETLKRHRSKTTGPNKEEVPSPPAPSITTEQPRSQISTAESTIPKYASLTEANLAEHTRLQERINNKHQCLVKWTEDLANCGRFSPPHPEEEEPIEIPITKEVNPPTIFNPKPHPIVPLPTSTPAPPTFLFPSSSPLDLRSFYPLLPYWQYPSWSFPIGKRLAQEPPPKPAEAKKEPLTFHLHTHHHHHHIHKSTKQPFVSQENLSRGKTTRRKSSPVKRRPSLPSKSLPSKRRSTSSPAPSSSSSPKKKPRHSSHWRLVGSSQRQRVVLHPDQPPVFRQCYTAIEHTTEKDLIRSHDCVLLRSEKRQQPFLAKVNYFWQEAESEEIRMSILWYYHPEHTDLPGHLKERFLANELLASKYADCISVACIEDKCYVLNFNEYNRLCAREKSGELFGSTAPIGQLRSLLNETSEQRPLPPLSVARQNIFFCRAVYDYRVKRILKNPSFVHTN